MVKKLTRSGKDCPNGPKVECGDGDGDHEPADSDAGYFHGYLLGVEACLYVEFGRKPGAKPPDFSPIAPEKLVV